jgi:S1-C subfamily serine protease
LVERAVDNGRDLYDSIDITRRFWFAAAHLQTGDSGAPVVDTQGAAVGVVFAVAPHSAADYKRAVYVLDRSEIDGFMAETAALGDRNVVSTGPCLK